jgi:hypothetical protein
MAEASSTATGKGKKKKALYIGLGILALGGLIYFLMRKKGGSTNVTINVANYSASDYEPLTDAQIKSKIDEVNSLINQVGVDETIKKLQDQIDSYMADGSPESLAYASLLEDVIADLETQTRSTSDVSAPSDMTMGMGVPSDMTMGMGVPSDMTMGMGVPSNMTMGGGVPTTPTLTASSIDATKYPLLSSSQIASELANTNSLVASKGVAGAIAELNARAGALLSSTNPIDQQLGLLLNDIIRLLGGTPLNTTLAPIRVIGTNPAPTPSTNDLNDFVDPSTRPLPTNIGTTPTPTMVAPQPVSLPQLNADSGFNSSTYTTIPQATIDTYLSQANAGVLANGVTPTVASLIAQSNTLASSANATDREIAQLLFDMAATLDIAQNPANASKYPPKEQYQRTWYDWAASYYNLNSATPNLSAFQQWLYNRWSTYGIDFTEPLQTNYRSQPYASAKNRYLASVITNNGGGGVGALAVLSNVIFNVTPSGKLINRRPARTN